MNQNKSWIIFMALSLVLITMLGSCATAPEVTQETVIEEHVVKETVTQETVPQETIEEEPAVKETDDTFVLEALAIAKVAKEDAIRARAPRAATAEYNEGEKNYSEGLDNYTKGNLDAAFDSYNLASIAYRHAIIIANEQKEIALAALANAEAAIAQTELNANNAIAKGLEEENE